MHGMGWGAIKITAADKWFSFFVRFRANWTCEIPGCRVECKRRKYNNPDLPMASIQCGHFFTRASKSTRLHKDGAMAICFNHHRYYTEHQTEWENLLIEKLGEEKYWALKRLSRSPTTIWKIQEKALRDEYKEKVFQMAKESGRLWVIQGTLSD